MPDCIQLSLKLVNEIGWLPPTCAYALVRDGEDLYWWHHLVSGDPETIHVAGISARGRTVNEKDVEVDDFEDYVVGLAADGWGKAGSAAAGVRLAFTAFPHSCCEAGVWFHMGNVANLCFWSIADIPQPFPGV